MISSNTSKIKHKPRPNSAKQLERQIALLIVFIPWLGTIAAFILLWKHGIGLVELGLCLSMYVVTTLGVTAGFHRLFTHRSFQTGRTIQVLLGIAGSMAAQGPILFWVACHRRHHQNSDRPNDPHSPNLYTQGIRGRLAGFWHAHLGWMFNHDSEDWVRFVPELLRDQLIFKVNNWYFLWIFLGCLIPAILGGLLTWTWQGIISGLFWGGFVRIFLVHHSTWSINSICHIYGSRPYETNDESTNNFLCALLACGEGWHNNHHAFPASARHGLEWWQFDLTYLVIHLLEKTGLIWDVKLPTAKMLEVKKRELNIGRI
ncbi:acyl-CoA desaturase [Nostoc sp. C117]|uniref:acyl-CoA desaturase n=1 Tax=Nostoc sp. C117 TaxID=3349875 RepID=UPI00370DB0AC